MESCKARAGKKSKVMAMQGISGLKRKSQWLRLSIEKTVIISKMVAAPPANRANNCVVRSDDGRMICVDMERRAPKAKPKRSTGSAKRMEKGPFFTGRAVKIGIAWRTA